MESDKNTARATFQGISTPLKGLIQLKQAHQQGLKLLEDETKLKRSQLAAKLRTKRKTAYQLAYRSAIKKSEIDVRELLNTAREQYDKCLLQTNKDCLELALKVAEEIIQNEITINTQSLAKRIKLGVEKLMNVDNLNITVNQTHAEELKTIFKNYPKKVRIHIDNNLEPGNSLIETDSGDISLNWKTQLEMMRHLLLSKIQSNLCS